MTIKKKIKCFFGFHVWRFSGAKVNLTRKCKCCKKEQIRLHCPIGDQWSWITYTDKK